MKIHFGHRVGKYNSSTELPRNFCAGIGPLQLDVVLVCFFLHFSSLQCLLLRLSYILDYSLIIILLTQEYNV